MRNLVLLIIALCASFASAGVITVTSPSSGDYLGTSNNVKFLITGAVVQVKVVVTCTLDSNPSISVTVERSFDPDGDGEIDNSVPLNFGESTPEGAYTLTVVATEPGATYNTPPAIPVNVDVKKPKFGNSNPLAGSFVKGLVPITVDLDEPNVKEWRVKINSADIPNNSGSTSLISVDWDSNTIIQDGAQTINISVEDLAKNTANKDINITIDRIKPSSNVLAPLSGSVVRPGSKFSVIVEITDQFQGSIHWTGLNIRITDTSGNQIMLVPRKSLTSNGNKITWTGQVRAGAFLPDNYRILVDAVDRAGNVATQQIITISSSRRRN
jgi:flagellar hook assembly protein FlgD